MKNYLIIFSLICLFSCKRDSTTPDTPPPVNAPKITVKLRIGGTSDPGAKTAYDSTIYAVNIRTYKGVLYAQGLFDTQDSIAIDLLKDSVYNIDLAAIKKGTGAGLWWETVSGYKKYAYPVNRNLRNRMFYAANEGGAGTEAMQPKFIDTLNYMRIVTNTSTNTYATYKFSEFDTYYGSTLYGATDTNNTVITMVMKRIGFGIQYDINNLTSGMLIADYGGVRVADTMTADGTQKLRSFTANELRYSDSIPGNQLQVTLKLVQPGGGIVVLGTKPVRPNRNKLTTIQVFLDFSPSNQHPTVVLNDTAWLGNTDFNFN